MNHNKVTEGNTNIFVYGSLKEGFERGHMFKPLEPRVPGKTVQKFHMKRAAWPYIRPDSKGFPVSGEFCVVDDKNLQILDMIEGYPNLFDKRNIHVELDTGEQVSATVYILSDTQAEHIPEYFQEVLPNSEGVLVYT